MVYFQNLSSSSPNQSQPAQPKWEESLTSPWQSSGPQDLPSSVDMLRLCFDKIFLDLTSKESGSSLELVLQLWLTLNLDNPLEPSDSRAFDSSIVPTVALSPAAISGLISVLASRAAVSVRCWCLAFQTLTLVSNLPSSHSDNSLDSSLQRMASAIVSDANFSQLLLSFFSSAQIKGCAGVTVCQCLHEMLVRLEMRCDVVSNTSQLGCHFKLLLLQVFDKLVQPTGAIALQQGPLDAQAKLVQLMLHLDFTNTDVNTAVSILNAVALLVHSYMLSGEGVRWRSIMECSLNAVSSASNNGSSISSGSSGSGSGGSGGGGSGAKTKPMAWDLLVTSVVKLATSLVQIPLEAPQPSATSQTDEHKAASNKVPCVADMVTQQERTMHCLLRSLGMSHTALPTDTQEPSSVSQAVFQLLSTIARKATSPAFVLKPVFAYISTNEGGFSEPLLSLLLCVIDGPEALQQFVALGALEVVCDNLVRANHGLVNCQPSTVSIVMQHLSQAPSLLLPQAPTTKKAADIASGLLNFAPLGTISSSNSTAQPADVLIQSAPPHRRARAPAWSYHFYPNESWVELTLTLPCAVLLREVHLQPHLTSLATCPSGVGLEISRDGRSPLVPIGLPLDSSGLTFIRLQLPRPEVVTTVLLRLYKPRDSPNIGLSQIRLLGNTTFSDNSHLSLEDEEPTVDSSLVWVRLVHHCLSVCVEPQLRANVVAATTKVPGLLRACCGLLLVPAAAVYTPCLQHILYMLGYHHPDLGLQTITTLLTNGSHQEEVHVFVHVTL
ncbi:Baculoviral IAP repeat-containing protein 6 [Homalodisca vitripennis]|nr:Baculoviral IAP repeat-containing protein 6 [Homalodisca vitripennis]